ncbi:MAG: 1-(5-phosphoribosyl)-5-[Clostridia bacterium]|nr:1-(5-phosphoribosyl)-5-[(5-phosphoribosylamino)methylideneamino]imidazole-4-carboxamide isomerase [Clostridia bacterium]
MKLFPAFDLYGQKAVRLFKGNYDNMTVYHDDPFAVAQTFESLGARYVHLVDLEGARDGTTPHLKLVQKIAGQTSLVTEIGGGIRDMNTVEQYLQNGVDRVILGTAAVENHAFLQAAVDRFGDRIAVGVDVRDGFVAVKGWTEQSDQTCFAFCEQMQQMGVKTLICTDISKDGAMKGTNRELYRELSARFTVDITASGGVSTLDDLTVLKEMGLYGAILGKAYYTGAIDLKEALEEVR